MRLDTISAPDEATGWSELPKDFFRLVNRSLSLQNVIRRMDEELYGAAGRQPARRSNPVSDQISLLNTAFARG